MLQSIPRVDINQKSPQIKFKSTLKTNDLHSDTFVKTKKLEPSFGMSGPHILPTNKIMRSCDRFLQEVVNPASSIGDLAEYSKVFFYYYLPRSLGKDSMLHVISKDTELPKWVESDPIFSDFLKGLPADENEYEQQCGELVKAFRHELFNKYTGQAANASVIDYLIADLEFKPPKDIKILRFLRIPQRFSTLLEKFENKSSSKINLNKLLSEQKTKIKSASKAIKKSLEFLRIPQKFSTFFEKLKHKSPPDIPPQKLLSYQKKQIKSAIKAVKKCCQNWSILEKWASNPDESIPMKNFLKVLKKTLIRAEIGNNAKFQGLDVFRGPLFDCDGPKVQNPFQLYNLISQPILNADKYGDGKPFSVIFNKIGNGRKASYYLSVTNPETAVIPDEEIDIILEGTGHRAEKTKEEVKGTGFGFKEMIRILRENGYEKDIPNLIEKGREKGVCVNIPLIGVSNPLELF